MKEIWKLIELLNEFEPYIASDGEHRDNLWGYAYQWHSAVFPKELAESYIISKSYGFIKWLVENDKIDTSKANDKNLNGYEIELRIRAVKELVADSEEKTVLYLNLLMLLAIQDEPIRFLCEILK